MSVVGKRVIRSESQHRVIGAGLFADDIKYPDMLEAAVVRSQIARGKILKVDFGQLGKINGFQGVFTFKDIPGRNAIPIVIDDQPFLAERNVNYIGEPIAVVVADNRNAARIAAMKAEVRIKKQSPLLDPLQARNHPEIHPFGEDNVFKHMRIRRGDVDSAFRDCDIIIENEYRTPYQEHAYIEPQAMIAIPCPDGSIEIRGSMQCPFYVSKAITTVLGLPETKVRVIQTATGGAF